MVKLNVRKKMDTVLVKWVILVTQPDSRTSVNNLRVPTVISRKVMSELS